MLEFTTPQSGDPQKNKAAIAYQVRRHAARVAAARQKRICKPRQAAELAPGTDSPLESCFLLNLDTEAEQSRQNSVEVVKKTKEHGQGAHASKILRPRWTSVYRLELSKKPSPRSNAKSSPSATPSPLSTPSSISDSEQQADVGVTSIFDYADTLPWPGPLHPFAETSFNSAHFATDLEGSWDDNSTWFPSLLTSGKHIPDVSASMLALQLGSGFGEINHWPPLLSQAQRRAVAITVALDHFQRESMGAPLLEDIFEEAEQSQRLFREVETASTTCATGDSLLSECCRQASLLYYEFVLFPSLSEENMMAHLARELRTTLEADDFWISEEGVDSPVSHLLLWATVLGAMAESRTNGRVWFVRRVSKRLLSDTRLWDWHLFSTLLSRFLWWQPICDQPGQQVWEEAIKFRQLVETSRTRQNNIT